MDAASDPEVELVVYLAASQGGGKTELLLNALGLYMDVDPAPILVVEPTLEMAEALSKDRVAPMIRETPSLAEKVSDARTRDSGNTIRHKEFPGGHATFVGANSASGLSMRPIRVLLCDELRGWPLSAGSEGDPLTIVTARLSSYEVLGMAREMHASSPDRKGSRLFDLWETTDQREWMVPCGDCGHRQALKWSQVQWEKDEDGRHQPQTAVYACERCGSAWDDQDRWKAIMAGAWEPQKPSRGRAGFRLPAMAVLGRRLEEIVDKWIEAQGNPEQLKAFLNTALAEWWEEAGETVDETGLLGMRERWSLPQGVEIPAGVTVLTLGADTQQDYIQYELVGWGEGQESWSPRWGRLIGDPKQDAQVLEELDQLLGRPWRHASGQDLYIRAACIDTQGHATQVLYRWCAPRIARRGPDGRIQLLFGTKGFAGPRPVWPDKRAKARRKLLGLPFPVPVGVDSAKDQVYARLRIVDPGPGRCHWPMDRELAFFQQLTAERKVPRHRAGRLQYAWELKTKGRPNEALDCRVLAYAALCALEQEGFDFDGEGLRLGLGPHPRPPAAPQPARPAPRRRVRRSRYLGGR